MEIVPQMFAGLLSVFAWAPGIIVTGLLWHKSPATQIMTATAIGVALALLFYFLLRNSDAIAYLSPGRGIRTPFNVIVVAAITTFAWAYGAMAFRRSRSRPA